MELRTGFRFSPHVLVLPLTLYAATWPLAGLLVSGISWWWDTSFAKVDYVMDEARPNDGFPYISGHFDGTTEPYNLVGRTVGETIVLRDVPSEAFAAGKHVPVWYSPEAPDFVAFGKDTNGIPVAFMPERPGFASVILYLVWLLATFYAGLWIMVRVAARWSRVGGRSIKMPDPF